MPDYVELLVARRVGRDLRPIEALVVQGIVLVVFVGLLWLGAASGFFGAVFTTLGQSYTHLVFRPTTGQ